MTMFSCPPWQRELALCDKFLSMDERNFHCWDYRHLVAARAGRENSAELEFTRDKINDNFSNYSAWHFRSKLLSVEHPSHDQSQHTLQETVHHEELELVQNAAFTDPDDSSAWFYHTWLLGHQSSDAAQLLFIKKRDSSITVSSTRPVSLSQLQVSGAGVEWSVSSARVRSVWSGQLRSGGQLQVSLGQETLEMTVDDGDKHILGDAFKNINFHPAPSEATKKVLLEELENVDQLLELEPDSKWPCYTRTMIMMYLDSEGYFSEILEAFDKLKQVDHMRRGYYDDMKSKFVIEHSLEKHALSSSFDVLDLSEYKVTKLFHKQYLEIFKEVKW